MRGQKRKKSATDRQQLRTLIESVRGDDYPASEFFCVCLVPSSCRQVSKEKFEQIVKECNASVVKGNGRMVCGSAADVAAVEAKMKMEMEDKEDGEEERKSEERKSPVKRRKVTDAVAPPLTQKTTNEAILSRSSRRSRPRISYAAMASGQEYKIEDELDERGKTEEGDESNGGEGMEESEAEIESESNSMRENESETVKEIDNSESETKNENETENENETIGTEEQDESGELVSGVVGDMECDGETAEEVHLTREIQDEAEEKLILGLIEGNYTVTVEEAGFSCSECEHVSKTAKGLKSHKVYMHGTRSIVCDVCFGRFNYQYQMGTHRKKHFDSLGQLTPVAKAMCRSSMQKLGKTREDLSDLIAQQFSDGEDVEVKKEGQFSCDICAMVLPTEKALRLHYGHGCNGKKKAQLGLKDSRMECPHCDFVCFRVQTFSRHVQAHNKPALYKCDQCEYSNTMRGEVNRHKRNAHSEKTIQCPQCATKFRNHILLNQHIKQKHLKAYMRMCTHCGKEMQASAYKEHFRLFHGPDAETERRTYVCKKCGRLLRTKRAYEKHMASAHTEDNPEEEEIARTLVVNEQQQCSCRLCGFSAKYAKTVVRHIVQVHAERRHACELCGAAFAREKLLHRHVDIFHRKLERCSCDHCGRSFHSKQHLRGHLQRMHVPGYQHSCDICGKGFNLTQSLLQHMQLHKPEGERTYPFPCDSCDKKFYIKSALTKHQEEHSGEFQHVCNICSEVFRSQPLLNQHTLIHTQPFTCTVCQKAFKMKKYLDKHMLNHANDSKLMGEADSLVCTRCGELFNTMDEVPNHVCTQQSSATEQVQDSYICMACGVQFSTATEAEAHSCTVSLMPQQALVLEQMSDDIASQVDHLVTGVVVLEQDKTEEPPPQKKEEEASEIFLCGICRQMFQTSDEINLHLLEHEQNGDQAAAEPMMQLQGDHMQLQESHIQEAQLQEIHIQEGTMQDGEIEEVHLQVESTQLTQDLEPITM